MIFVNFLLNSRAEIFRFFFFNFLDFFGKVASDASRYFNRIIGLPQRQRHLYPAFLDVDYAQWIPLHGLPREWQLGDRAIGRSPAGCRRYKARGEFVPTDKRALGMTAIPACPGLRWQGAIGLCEQETGQHPYRS